MGYVGMYTIHLPTSREMMSRTNFMTAFKHIKFLVRRLQNENYQYIAHILSKVCTCVHCTQTDTYHPLGSQTRRLMHLPGT